MMYMYMQLITITGDQVIISPAPLKRDYMLILLTNTN